MKTLVFNGWAAGAEAWDLCTFEHDWIFSYIEQLDGLPERVIADSGDVVLVGFSMGGSSALRMLLRFPSQVKGLVLISTTPRMMEERREGAVWRGMSERRLAALKLGTEIFFRGDPSPLYEPRNMNRGLEYLKTVDLRADLLALRRSYPALEGIPVAILQSERDGVVRPDNAAFLRSVFPQAAVTMVPGGEHVLPVSVPELVDSAVAAVCDDLV